MSPVHNGGIRFGSFDPSGHGAGGRTRDSFVPGYVDMLVDSIERKGGTELTGRGKVFEVRGVGMSTVASIAAEVVEVAIELPPTFQVRIPGDGFDEFNRILKLRIAP